MNSHGNGQPKNYRLTHLGPVKQALAEQYARAKIQGHGAVFIAALEHVYNRLRSNPHSLGEPKYPLHALQLVVYLGIHLPVVVEFGIHDTEPLVVIRSLKYLDNP
jgi:hypothetical protein